MSEPRFWLISTSARQNKRACFHYERMITDGKWSFPLKCHLISKTCYSVYNVTRQNKRISQECVFFFFFFFFFFSHRVRCMLGFSCSICAPNSNISQHEAFKPSGNILLTQSQGHLANYSISSHNAEGLPVCWAALWRGSIFTIALPQQTLHHEGPSTPRLRALRYSERKVLPSFSRCCPHATLITPVENSGGMLFGSSPAAGLLTSSHSSFFSFTFFFFF